MLHKKHFSLHEAQSLLPEIKNTLSKITELKKLLDDKGYDIYKHQYFRGIGPNGTGKFPDDMEELIGLLNHISELGIIIKGIDNGLIDFPHIRNNGDEVYLCFLSGEYNIKYWHGINDGFAGRRPVGEL